MGGGGGGCRCGVVVLQNSFGTRIIFVGSSRGHEDSELSLVELAEEINVQHSESLAAVRPQIQLVLHLVNYPCDGGLAFPGFFHLPR